MAAVMGYEALAGVEKAAVLMLSLDQDHAVKLCSRLDLDEVVEISQTMSVLGEVDASVVERILHEFGESLAAGSGAVVGGYDTTEKLLRRFMDSGRVDAIMEEIRGPAGRTVWDQLGTVNESVLAAYLRNESPQTAAVVVAKLEPSHAARVIGELPEEFALEVVMRMLRLEVVQKDVLADVERTLRSDLMGSLARTSRRDSHAIMAEIFNFLDRTTEARLIGAMEERHREAADRIRGLMFTFEDLGKLDGQGIQTLLRAAGNDRIGIALKGASERVRDLFFANMSERGAKIMRDDMEAMGPVRLRDVEGAQQFLVRLAKELIASGEIFVAGGDADQLVY